MRFIETPLSGAFLIDLERRGDDRGFFARAYCAREFDDHGLATHMVQTNVSYSRERGTLRGMHYQAPPFEEAKLIRCTTGGIFDVMVDVRPDSTTFGEWFGETLTAENRRMLYVPKGFAHGFITIHPNSEVTYQVSQYYAPDAERGIRYDDPAIGISWPLDVAVISDKDMAWSPFEVVAVGGSR